MIRHSASTVNRSSLPLEILKMAHVQGGDCFCLRYLLSDESWRITLTQKTMEMDFCVVFCDMAELKPICLYPLGPYPEIHLIQYEISADSCTNFMIFSKLFFKSGLYCHAPKKLHQVVFQNKQILDTFHHKKQSYLLSNE